ncbi:MAG: helix-turn-helix domain-containing protein [Anaerolineaceae bacterium]|nr:helix-turn-helix domain-containing protein [Anaerolineaceae bacterium]
MAEADYPKVEKLLKPLEVASILRVSRTQAYRLMKSGELPAIRFGSATVRVRQSDLSKFINEHSSSSQSTGGK